MRNRLVTIGIIVVGTVVLIVFGTVRATSHRLQIKAYFDDAMGLKPGAPVRLAGIDIGTVRSVTPRPELREKPAEVAISVQSPRKIAIPRDSVAVLTTAGVLGETFVAIDTKAATGPPIEDGGTLQTQHPVSMSEVVAELAKKMETTASEVEKKLQAAQKPCEPAALQNPKQPDKPRR